MIKMIATDIDGTLVPEGSPSIDPAYFDVIAALHERGIHMVISSGRQFDSILQMFEPVKNKMFFITNNGAEIATAKRRLFTEYMAEEALPVLFSDCRALKICPMLVSDGEYTWCDRSSPESFIRLLCDEYRFHMKLAEDIAKVPHPVKLSVYYKGEGPHPAAALIPKWNRVYYGVVSGSEWVDFTAYGISKGKALRELQESLFVSPEETVVFGDQLNDISMFRQAAFSYAVPAASAAVQKEAFAITAPMEHNGVLRILQDILAKK